MDLLREEMARKRKAVDEHKRSRNEPSGSRFIMRAAQLRAFEEEKELERDEQRFEKVKANCVPKNSDEEEGSVPKKMMKSEHVEDVKEELKAGNKVDGDALDEVKKNNGSVTVDSSVADVEVIRQLRDFGQPIKLFGESNEARRHRLEDTLIAKENATIEEKEDDVNRDEFRLGSGHGIRNPFLSKDVVDDEGRQLLGNEVEEDQEDGDEKDEHKRIYRFFKTLLRRWEDELASRPEAIKRSAKGKVETKTLKQCKDYIRPLFKQCKKRTLAEDIMAHIIKIIDFCEAGEFVKAHDTYMDVAIGRAAWPIGVTMVGIHARSGREKIETGKVAHAMNSELQRKYLTSIKRLMTFCQKQRDDVAPSKKVIN